MSKKLKIISKKEGFRRGGLVFSMQEETIIDVAELNKKQIEQLKNEPMLVVTEFEETTEKPTKTKKKENKNKNKNKAPKEGDKNKAAEDPKAKTK